MRISGKAVAAVFAAIILIGPSAGTISGAQERVAVSIAGGTPNRGVVRAMYQATFSTELAVQVVSAPLREGQLFKKGDVLVELDCRRVKAEFDSASAVHREMKFTLESNTVLSRHGAVGRNDLEIARARVDKAEAEMRSLVARLDQCRVLAPFDGRVMEIGIRPHEMTSPSKPLLAVLADADLEIEIVVDSALLSQVQPGRSFIFRVDELGRDVASHVDRLGASVDPVSRTIKVIGLPVERVVGLLPGMSGSAVFER